MFDIVVVAVIGILILLGLLKGLVRQAVGLAGVIVGYVLAMKFYAPLAAKLLTGLRPATGHVAGFLIIFVACIVVASIVGWVAGKLLKIAGLGFLNRIAGALLGGVKGCLIVAAVTVMLVAFLPSDSSLLKGSGTFKYLRPVADTISRFAPEAVKKKYDAGLARLAHPSGLHRRQSPRGQNATIAQLQ